MSAIRHNSVSGTGADMPRSIATRATSGANKLVDELEQMLQKAMAEKGPNTPLLFANTVYYLPIVLGMTGKTVEKIGDLEFVLQEARRLLSDEAADRSGMAALLAAE